MDIIEKIKILNKIPKEGFGCFTEEEKEAFTVILNDCKKRYAYEERQHVCKNCGKPFIAKNRSDTYYCDRPSPQNPRETCKEYGPKSVYTKRYKDTEDWYSWYRKTYQLVQGRVRRNPEKYKTNLFEDFKITTKQWIKDVKSGKKTENEFINYLKNYREKIKSMKKLKY
ncbi:MAG: hypothetical protein K2P14_10300, partial [Anaeroplasmataceae bacterium]|nr:hypothetical protein [Anaeroplasmataceae bacterium]